MKLKDKWLKRWSFVKKLQYFLVSILFCIFFLTILISTVSWFFFVTEQNQKGVEEQLDLMAGEYSSSLEQYKAVAISIVLDQHVQKFCQFETNSIPLKQEASDVYHALLNLLNSQANANFIAVINNNIDTYVYTGNHSMTISNFENVYRNDFQDSIKAKDKGALRMSFADSYYWNSKYTLTVYFPVYSTTNLDTINGLVVINMEDSLLEHLNRRREHSLSSLYVMDAEGMILSHQNTERIGEKAIFNKQIMNSKGTFMFEGKQITYQKVNGWNYYLVNEIPVSYLYRNIMGVIGVMLAVMIVVLMISLWVTNRMAIKLYRPIETVLEGMNNVSIANLRKRIRTEGMDWDGMRLAEGFNVMMSEIDVLMEQVKEEQHIIDQMKFNGLQSQIQPHFLYNTLECIHWQAAAQGNKEVSTMVKALAQYYRICLSSGHDIIPLKRELEHIENYIIIQNMRYDDIIELNITVDEIYMDVRIPKLTLQPLIENSIEHGMKSVEEKRGSIAIYVKESVHYLQLFVEDNGSGMDDQKLAYINQTIGEFSTEIGYGINNVNKRIELLYGEGYGLCFYKKEAGGTIVEIRLPLPEQ